MTTIDEALDEIEAIADVSDLTKNRLVALFEHSDPEVRFRVLEKIFDLFYENAVPENILSLARRGLTDVDELVRCESLEIFNTIHTLIMKRLLIY